MFVAVENTSSNSAMDISPFPSKSIDLNTALSYLSLTNSYILVAQVMNSE